jgi:hypothetical protein
MKLDPNTGSIITEAQAKELINNFNAKFPGEVVSSFIGVNPIKKIVDQENCIGIRVYNGYDAITQKLSLVMVGVDQEEQDILENGIIYDKLAICPPLCSKNGLL